MAESKAGPVNQDQRARFEYLLSVKGDYRELLQSEHRRFTRQRNLLFWASTLFLAIYFLDLRGSQITLFGIQVDDLDLSRVLILVPVVVAYSFANYSYMRVSHRRYLLAFRAVRAELNAITEVNWQELREGKPYVSSRGTIYSLREKGRIARSGVRVLRIVRWLPVTLVFGLGTLEGARGALLSGDLLFVFAFFTTVVLCLTVVLVSRAASAFAYRRGRRVKDVSS